MPQRHGWLRKYRCFTQKAAQYPKLGCWAAFVS